MQTWTIKELAEVAWMDSQTVSAVAISGKPIYLAEADTYELEDFCREYEKNGRMGHEMNYGLTNENRRKHAEWYEIMRSELMWRKLGLKEEE